MPYHSVPVLNHINTKEELKELLQGECFEKVVPRRGIEKIYYLHASHDQHYEQIRLVYSNGEEFCFPSGRRTAGELSRGTEN